MRRLLLVLVLATAGLAGPWIPHAQACSCAGDATQWLSQTDGAIVGALVARDEDPPPVDGVSWSGTPVRHRYAVQQVLKGDVSTGTVDVWGTTDGASCGLSTPVGQQVGLLLRRDGGKWTSDLCSIADPDRLIEAARKPPAAPDTVLPAVLAGSTDGGHPDRRPLVAAAATVLLVAAAAARSIRRRPRATQLP